MPKKKEPDLRKVVHYPPVLWARMERYRKREAAKGLNVSSPELARRAIIGLLDKEKVR